MGLTLYLSLAITVMVLGQAYSSYVILAPNKMHPGWDYNLQVTVNGGTGTTTVTGSIVNAEKTVIQSGTIPVENGEPKQLTLQIPADVPRGHVYSLKVEGTGGLKFTNTTSVDVDSLRFLTFIQTDKKIYKAGQKVRFRIITVNKDLEPQRKAVVVKIKDPFGSILTSLRYNGTEDVITDIYELNDFPDLGEWVIEVKSLDKTILEERFFKVDEYVLPKFEVSLETHPQKVLASQNKGQVTVMFNATYTYGVPVKGNYEITVSSASSVLQTLGREIGPGSLQQAEIDLFEKLAGKTLEDISSFDIVVAVTDKSGFSYNASAKVEIVKDPVKILFDDEHTDLIFRPGQPIKAVIKVTNHDGEALEGGFAENPIVLTFSDNSGKEIQRKEVALTAGQKEVSWTATDSAGFDNVYTLRAAMKTPEDTPSFSDFRRVEKYMTLGNATLELNWSGDSSPMLEIGKDMSFRVDVSASSHFSSLIYVIVSRGNIQASGKLMAGQATTIKVTKAMCPNGKLIAYGTTTNSSVSTDPELIADRLDLKLRNCQEKMVIPSVSSKKLKTGTNTTIDVNVAWTDSTKSSSDIGQHTIHILAVDKSIIILEGSNDLTPQEVDKRLGEFALSKTEPSGMDDHGGFAREMIWQGSRSNNGPTSTGDLLEAMGLKSMSDVAMKKPKPVRIAFRNWAFEEAEMDSDAAGGDMMNKGNAAAGAGGGLPQPPPKNVVTVRKNFPDTWLWKQTDTDASGLAQLNEKTPDSITSWVISAFAVKEGDAMAVTANPFELNVFNELFLSLKLPYSIRRGEKFPFRVTVFNYSPIDRNVFVNLVEDEPNFSVAGGATRNTMVPKNSAESVTFMILGNKIGVISLNVTAESPGTPDDIRNFTDTVLRKLPVKPEGVMRMNSTTFPFYVPAVGEPPINQDIMLTIPEKFVPGSRRALVKVTGDLMANAMADLENLLKVPFGCGEQNMITTAPNVYATDYLLGIGELKSEFKNKAQTNVKRGYIREGEYQHGDGGYSAFGKGDAFASTWLTAFVVKCFSQASHLFPTVVDKSVLAQDIKFLFTRLKNSQFEELGKVIHKEMQGGTNGKEALSIFVASCLLEAVKYNIPVDSTKVDLINKLVTKVAEGNIVRDKPFLAAITAYAASFRGASSEDTVKKLIGYVKEKGAPWTKKVEENKESDVKPEFFYVPPRSGPSNIEITSYCLLAYCQLGKIAEGRELVLWLQTQQNGDGGFTSTQDTIVALHAIASYAKLFVQGGDNIRAKVEVTEVLPKGSTQNVTVDSSNVRVLQQMTLNDDTDEINIMVTGTPGTLAVVKVVWYYYIYPGQEENPKPDRPKPKPLVTKSKIVREGVQKVEICFPEDFGLDEMMLLEVNPPTGQGFDPEELKRIRKNRDVKRVEEKEDSLHVYFGSEPKGCIDMEMQETLKVEDTQNGAGILYAYYDPVSKVEAPIQLALESEVFCTGNDCTYSISSQPTLSCLLMSACICLLLSLLFAM